jgi:hypothetical protein
MRYWPFILLLLAIFGVVGCKDKEPLTVYVHQEMLPYCWFPHGGYWVYQEVTTPGWIDSTYSVGDPVISIVPDVFGEGYESESYNAAFMIRGKRWGRGILGFGYGDNFQYSLSEVSESFSDSTGQRRDEVFFWDVVHSDTLFRYPTTLVRQRFDSISIQGRVYYDAIEIVTDPLQAAEHSHEVIWAKGVGVVRRSMVDGTIWELVRYHIN